jgi:hypothetical protein
VEQIPAIGEKMPNWDTYGKATVNDILDENQRKAAEYLFANLFHSVYLENVDGQKFNLTKMPIEMQISTVFGMVVCDFNQDGNLDLLSHGNFYHTEVETNRQDAGIGLYLTGDGAGNFEPVSVLESGFYSPGDAKGLAMIAVGSEPKPVVLAANNNGKMRAFELNDFDGNVLKFEQDDDFATITFSDGSTRKQEIYQGSGYLSRSTRLKIVTSKMTEVAVTSKSGDIREIDLKPTEAMK